MWVRDVVVVVTLLLFCYRDLSRDFTPRYGFEMGVYYDVTDRIKIM